MHLGFVVSPMHFRQQVAESKISGIHVLSFYYRLNLGRSDLHLLNTILLVFLFFESLYQIISLWIKLKAGVAEI